MKISSTITIRIRRQTHRRLRRLADAQGKGLPEFLDELSRQARVDAVDVLERIQDLLDARELAAASNNPKQSWVALEQLDKDLGLKWTGRRAGKARRG